MKWLSRVFIIVFFLICPVHKTEAVSVSEVETTVKINVCGDGVAEGPEECDGSDFASATCLSQGFASGTLACDLACDLDTAGCFGVAPTPTSLPTPTPTPTSASTATDDDSETEDDETTIVQTVVTATPVTTAIVEQIVEAIQQLPAIGLPPAVAALDVNNDDSLDIAEMSQVVSRWVNNWRSHVTQNLLEVDPDLAFAAPVSEVQQQEITSGCDINEDEQCNLVDLSIILYYVGK